MPPPAPPPASAPPRRAARAGPGRAAASWRLLPGSSRGVDGTSEVRRPRLGDAFERGAGLRAGPDDGVGETERIELVEEVREARGVGIGGPRVVAALARLAQPDAHCPPDRVALPPDGVAGRVEIRHPFSEHVVDP